MKRHTLGILTIAFFFLVAISYAQVAQQIISLQKGWNGVYLEVQPEDSACDQVFKDWPVRSVSLYNMEKTYAQYTETPEEPLDPEADYQTWIPGHPAGAHSLHSVLAGHAYLIYAEEDFNSMLTGRAYVPRIDWIPSESSNVVNLVGFRVSDSATFGPYLNGAGFNSITVYTVGGTNASSPETTKLGSFNGGISSVPIERGKAYFIAVDKASDFCGPLRVSPSGDRGVVFPSSRSYASARLKNESGADLTVTVDLIPSSPLSNGTTPVLPTLHVFDFLKGWSVFSNTLSKTLSPGETWDLSLAVDRTNMNEGEPVGGILVCNDAKGGRVDVPVEVEYSDPTLSQAPWPAGLWVGKASLSRATQMLGDGTKIEDQPAGSLMEYRLILHVNTQGRCRLLQRAIVAGQENADGSWNTHIYLDEDKVPAESENTARLSSVAFGLKNDIAWDESYGTFGDKLRFTYAIAHDDPVNPFLHARHPNHDGLEYDFKTPLPSGDNPTNYIGAIKPETFSVSNTISMVWTQDTTSNQGGPFWNPSETVSGDYTHLIYGLRKEGAIQMNGRFTLRRISRIGTVSTE